MAASVEPSASLKYWIKVNEKVYNVARQIGEKRKFLINFDKLCLFPESEIKRLLTFLDVKVDVNVYEETLRIPRAPLSMGRYKQHDINQFDSGDLSLLPNFGYSVE